MRSWITVLIKAAKVHRGETQSNSCILSKNSLFEQMWWLHPEETTVLPSCLSLERICSQRIMWAFFSPISSFFSHLHHMLNILVLTFLEDRSVGTTPVYKSISKQHIHANSNTNRFSGEVCIKLWGVFCLYVELCNGFVFCYVVMRTFSSLVDL